MPGTNDFMHLSLPVKKDGEWKLPQTPVPGKETTTQNKSNRSGHQQAIRTQAQQLSRFWQERQDARINQSLPTVAGGVPFLLEIEPTTDVEFLRGLGFEVVCDLDEGFIVVSSEQTNLADFLQKVDGFVDNVRGTGNVAKVYSLHTDDDRLKRILSQELYNQWSTLDSGAPYTVDISVGCSGIGSPPTLPSQRTNETEDDYNARVRQKIQQYQQAVDDLIMERQDQLETMVAYYNGEFLSSFIEDGDSFSVTMRINGAGLRDVVLNYSYIFEVSFKSPAVCETVTTNAQEVSEDLFIEKPLPESPIVCVIDSGIQENHRYIEEAILSSDSKCLIPGQIDINDEVRYGGHGTRVAGAVLYPKGIPTSGTYVLPCFIRNLKILDGSNGLFDSVSREGIIEEAVNLYSVNTDNKTKIFNHSVGEGKPFYDLKHMSAWAAKIDEVSYEQDVLFVQAAGNIKAEVIKSHIQAGYQYPDYLGQPLSQISNPGQSLQALTVGSVSHTDFEDEDTEAMGKTNEPSSFTRVGPGIWDSIKPDVVEYGGTHAINKNGSDINLTTPAEVCTDLIRRSPPGPAYSKDDIGTSFAAPKVSYIASEVQKTLPNSPSLLYRALIAQSARWPNISANIQNEDAKKMLRRVGYGFPDVNRAVQNNKYRATLISTELLEIADKEAHIFTVNIPQELRDVGENYNILLEITLSYAAKPKRTRRSYKNYLSTWLDWTCSKKNESRQHFEARIFEADATGQDDGQFPWMIHERQNWGIAKDFARSKQTLQKDWCIINSSDLNDSFCIAVRGHKGWGSLFKAKYAISVSFEAIDENIEIYEIIRLENTVDVDVETPEVRVEVDG